MEVEAIQVIPKDDAETKRISKEVEWAKEEATKLLVVNEDSAKMATAILSDIAKMKKAAEARRVFLVKPLNDHVKSINEWFKQMLAPADEADRILRRKVLDYRDEERRKGEEEARKAREEQQRKADELISKGKLEEAKKVQEGALPEIAIPKTIDSGMGSATERLVWTYEIEDFPKFVRYASSTGNEHLLEPRPKEISTLLASGAREVPGLKIFQKSVLVVR